MAVRLCDWNRRLTQSPGNQIQSCMALTNIVLQCIMTSDGFLVLFQPYLVFSTKVISARNLLLSFFANLSFWLTAWLCSFYCVTIVRFHHEVITSLKMRLPDVVPKLLLGTLLLSFSISVPTIWYIKFVTESTTSANLTGNYSAMTAFVFYHNSTFTSIFITIGCIMPLVITLTSIGFTVASLLRHVQQMKLNAPSLSAAQLEAHYRACRTMVLLVILYVTFNVTAIRFPFSNLSFEFFLIIWLILLLYPTVQAVILIMGSSELKGTLSQIIGCTR
ncbi:taste receptor type 2 member 9-like [Bombina bombina]|uniref:taste receptor type 2 member 9-like n=1 Tax=Bombina bombina TaxID=8345 RepID=UPI00235B2B82|nr:taste receptor type 2 member 9-like [Bombina bombina]